MSIKPILFSTSMVKEILAGRKTQTRRVIVPPLWSTGTQADFAEEEDGTISTICENTGCFSAILPRYRKGDILWVRETFFEHKGMYYYKADGKHKPLDKLIGGSFFKWWPSIHMPKAAARIFLHVTDVRVERVQDINCDDAMDEGITLDFDGDCYESDYMDKFHELWDSINAKRGYGWEENPWVWVYTFERCEKPTEWP